MNWNELWNDMGPSVLGWGSRVVGVLAVLFAAWVIAGWLGRLVRDQLEERQFDATLTRFFSKAVRYSILTFAVLGCLGVFGIQTASFAALVAAGGLAVGLAFQGTLSNFAAGVMLLVFRPFKVGEIIKVAGEMGSVEEIELFTTELRTPDARRIILPNGAIFGATIQNLTHYELRRVDIPVGVDYRADLDRTAKILEDAAQTAEYVVAEPAPAAFLAALGASSVDYELRVWCKAEDYWDAHQSAIRAAKRALDESNISIPFPQVDVHLDDTTLQAFNRKAA